MNNAGTEMVIMNLYRNINKNKVQFDFLVQKSGELDNDIQNMGGRVFYLPVENKRIYTHKLAIFFAEHKEYNIIHTHTHSEMGLVLKIASEAGIRIRIAHSHNARTDLLSIFSLYKRISSRKIEKYATNFFACSSNAAKWLYPTKYKQCQIVYNGIDISKFKYSVEKRKKSGNI
jgi:hypothetical protein